MTPARPRRQLRMPEWRPAGGEVPGRGGGLRCAFPHYGDDPEHPDQRSSSARALSAEIARTAMRARRRSMRLATSGVQARPIATPGSRVRLRPTPAIRKTPMLASANRAMARPWRRRCTACRAAVQALRAEGRSRSAARGRRPGAEDADATPPSRSVSLPARIGARPCSAARRQGSTLRMSARDADRRGRRAIPRRSQCRTADRVAGAGMGISTSSLTPRDDGGKDHDRAQRQSRDECGINECQQRRGEQCHAHAGGTSEGRMPRRRSSISSANRAASVCDH